MPQHLRKTAKPSTAFCLMFLLGEVVSFFLSPSPTVVCMQVLFHGSLHVSGRFSGKIK